MIIGKMQIGKNGFTDGTLEALRNTFKNHENVRISLLKNCSDRVEIEKIAKKIVDSLGRNYTYKIIGFTIIIQKWRKAR